MQVSVPKEDASGKETDARPTHQSFLACRYYSALDIFRFLSILMVIWHHTEDGFPWLPASTRGFLGVDFFFVISGFLIVTLLLREQARTDSISLRQFYLRRSLRIFPIYYAMLGTLTLFMALAKSSSDPSRQLFFQTLPYQVFYLSNFDSTVTILFFTWSLSTEEQFYLVWPPVERWLGRFAVPLLLVVIAVNQLVNFGLPHGLWDQIRSHSIGQITFTPICFGVLLAHLLHDPRWFDRVAKWLGGWWTSLALGVALLLVCNVPTPDLSGWPRLSIQVVMTLLLASCVIREDNGLNRILGFRVIRRIGVISYGMYIYHEFTTHLARTALHRFKITGPPWLFLLSLLLTIVVAELSFRFYETPFLRLKERLGRASRSTPTSPVASTNREDA